MFSPCMFVSSVLFIRLLCASAVFLFVHRATPPAQCVIHHVKPPTVRFQPGETTAAIPGHLRAHNCTYVVLPQVFLVYDLAIQ